MRWKTIIKIIYIIGFIVSTIASIFYLGELCGYSLNILFLKDIFSFLGWNILLVPLFSFLFFFLWLKLKKSKNILLSLPRSDKAEYFWGRFKSLVNDFLNKRGYRGQLADLEEEYNQDQQSNYLLNPKNLKDIEGGIIAPAGPKVLETISKMIKTRKTPLVIHDITPEDHDKYFSEMEFAAPPYIPINNVIGGQLAAKIMSDYLKQKKNMQPPYTILIIPGKSNQTHSKNRISGFIHNFRQLSENQVVFFYTGDGKWNYENCKEVLDHFINNILTTLPINEIHGIFACNDEMAICADDLIEQKIKDNHPNKDKLINSNIVGFDATQELMRKIKDQSSRIIGTIDSKIKEQAERVANLIIDLIEGKKINKKEERTIIPEESQ